MRAFLRHIAGLWNGSWLARQWARLFLPVAPQTSFMNLPAVKAALHTSDPERAAEVLTEAREIYAVPTARAEGVERRATTLLGTVAIAGSFSVAGAGLLLDGGRVDGSIWRTLIAFGFFATTACFAMCGWRAVLALSRLHRWTLPLDSDIAKRAKMALPQARVDLAASLLKAAGANEPIAAWKVAYLGAATWWFVRALALLVLTALLLVGYAATASDGSSDKTKQEKRSFGSAST